jgi:uncharacterized protein
LFAWTTGAIVVLGLVWARLAIHRGRPSAPHLAVDPEQIVADGFDSATLSIDAPLSTRPRLAIAEGPHGATVDEPVRAGELWQAQVRAGINPGRIGIRVEAPGFPAVSAALTSTLYTADHAQDGTPDFLRLADEGDRQAFRRWFTWIAEAQFFQAPFNRPGEINDCAALIRYAYREALRPHGSGWAEGARVPIVPAFAPITKYEYPYTPLGAALFRVQPGPFRPGDLRSGAFAQFADAQTLWRFNTYRVGGDLDRALPGDLLFFRHEAGRMPFHSMIWLGESQLRRDGQRYVLYHTGPDAGGPGEMRRLTLPELLRYPQPEWRPVPGNRTFLGVFRWNILRKAFER